MKSAARGPKRIGLSLAVGALAFATTAGAQVLAGDLDGSGSLDAADEAWLGLSYGLDAAAPSFAPQADLDASGAVDVSDLALFGAAFGASGGAPDTAAPALVISLNDVPEDMNDLLVVPPGGFEITLRFDALGGSVIDPSSLSIRSTQAIGTLAAGSELAGQFTIGQQRAVWSVPAGSNLARTSHFLTASVRDAAGNSSGDQGYGFAVRDFAYGAPLGGAEQQIFLDFGRNRSLGPDVDFVEDLRTYGLSAASAPTLEQQMRAWAESEILEKVHAYYGRNADGSAAADSVNVRFRSSTPAGGYSRLCVGGASSLGAAYLGASVLDTNNLNKTQDDCATGNQYGVFPQAIVTLWGNSSAFRAIFDPLMASRGGTPVGMHLLDGVVLAPGFDPATAPPEQSARWAVITNALDAFSQAVATAVAHESGHYLGLVAHGAAPGGLYGGSAGGVADHNVTVGGSAPAENYIMNPGGSFTFSEVAARGGMPMPVFRPLNWAYLRDRVVLDGSVTGLYAAPTLSGVTPALVDLGPPDTAVVTLHGTGFLGTVYVDLLTEGDPTPNPLIGIVLVNPTTLTGVVNRYLVPPATYDVRLRNGDGQTVTLPDALVVQ